MTWRKKLKHDISVLYKSESTHLGTSEINLSKNLSPLTNFILDTFTDSFQDKNLIVTFPNEYFGPKLLLAYTFSYLTKKSTLIFTGSSENTSKENSNKILNDTYHLLYNERFNAFIYKWVPITKYKYSRTTRKNFLELDLYSPLQRRGFNKEKAQIRENLLYNDDPKIVLSYQSNFDKIKSTISDIVLDDNNNLEDDILDEDFNLEEDIIQKKESIEDTSDEHDLNIGCIIIENADRFISNSYQYQIFIEWINEKIEDDLRIVLHFNNPDNNYIEDIKKELDALVISTNKSLLMSNSILSKDSLEYFEENESSKLFNDLIEKHNIDAKYYYEDNLDIDVLSESIDSVGIDQLFQETYALSYSVNTDNLKNSQLFFIARKLMFNLPNLAISPSFYTFSISYPYWHTTTIPRYLKTYRNFVLKYEKHESKRKILHFINALNNLYYRLANTKKYAEEKTYHLVGKDYKLFDLLANKNNIFGQNANIVVATLNKYEPNTIKSIIQDNNLFSLQNIEIEYIENIGKRILNKKDKILILPGLIPNQYLFQVYEPYKKIIILAYDNFNKKWINKEVDFVMNPSLEHEAESIKYLMEIYEYLGKPIDTGIIADFNQRLIEYKQLQKEKDKEREVKGETNVEVITSDKEEQFNLDDEFFDNFEDKQQVFNFTFKSFEEFMINWEETDKKVEEKDESDEKLIEHETNYHSINFKLYNISNGEFSRKKLPINRTFFTFNEYDVGKGEECAPYSIEEGNLVLIIDNDVRKSLLDFAMELNNLRTSYNSEEIEYWKEKLLEYIDINQPNLQILYNNYQKLGGKRSYQAFRHWCNGNRIGPQKSEDLFLIGQLIGDEYLQDNYRYMMAGIDYVRNYHRITGRYLKKMIEYIISGKEISRLSKMESVIYNSVKDSIYQVIEKDDSDLKDDD